MSKKRPWVLGSSIIMFLALIALAILMQSELFLYAASALPVLIVACLPDIRQNQYVRGAKSRKSIQMFKQTHENESLLIVSFEAGFVRWNCSKLYFHLDDMQMNPNRFDTVQSHAVSLPVLTYDLSVHPRKAGWVGIDLAQLAQRTANLSYTTDEITRLVIHMSDLEEIILNLSPGSQTPTGRSKSKSISA
ncbi:hypothetical protein [Paenibacillus xerothermodurans]|uniref:Uncharacterized protein n=1 Tax=Paenibacillus xerothermodurans TaxID=1977292 RepID=A0A2W1N8P0_PAEXE|nr:hypothetical protein [Paenibacillus xerothermodurans]PZE20747.1 hypothetical protein CBW46_011320 [Paenibacillus xerothermodurans]